MTEKVYFRRKNKYKNLDEETENETKLSKKCVRPELSDRSSSLTVPTKKKKIKHVKGHRDVKMHALDAVEGRGHHEVNVHVRGQDDHGVNVHVLDADSPAVVVSDQTALIDDDVIEVKRLTEGIEKIAIDPSPAKKKKKKKIRKRLKKNLWKAARRSWRYLRDGLALYVAVTPTMTVTPNFTSNLADLTRKMQEKKKK